MRWMNACYQHERFPYVFAILVSLLLSFFINFREVVINYDAICYVSSAEAVQYGISYVMHLCDQARWPFYSVLIYGFAQLSHLSYVVAAHTLDSFFTH